MALFLEINQLEKKTETQGTTKTNPKSTSKTKSNQESKNNKQSPTKRAQAKQRATKKATKSKKTQQKNTSNTQRVVWRGRVGLDWTRVFSDAGSSVALLVSFFFWCLVETKKTSKKSDQKCDFLPGIGEKKGNKKRPKVHQKVDPPPKVRQNARQKVDPSKKCARKPG